MIGTTLKHYKVIRQLGSGGMGDVYVAEDTTLDRQVALKVLPPDMAADPERLARFEREAKAIAALDHPNIVTIHTIEEVDDVRFITMQLVEGRTLEQILHAEGAGGLPLREIFEIGAPLAEAISVAHERGITHRDLKPSNVMVTDDGHVMVLDFGLAKLRDAGEGPDDETRMATESLTGEGKIIGTVAYMSPEQAEGKPVDQRTDIFSLGIMLYEMSTGARPFRGDTKMSILTSIIRDTPPPVTDVNVTLPRHVGRIIKHCLEKDPDRRFQSAKDLRNELDELRDELDTREIEAYVRDSELESGATAAPPAVEAGPSLDASAPVIEPSLPRVEVAADSEPLAVAAAPRSFLRTRWPLALAAIAVVALAGAWLVRLQADSRRIQQAADDLIPLAEDGRFDELYDGVLAARLDLDDPRIAELAAVATGTLEVSIDPVSAAVTLTRVNPIDGFESRPSEPITQGAAGPLISGQYLVGVSDAGRVPITFLVDVGVGEEISVRRALVETDESRGEMVLVGAGPSPLGAGQNVAAFLIDKHEVTSAEYLEFVTAGGYRDAELWPAVLAIAGNVQPWAEAVRTFVDRTSLAGPRGWSGGRYPDGTEDHPVTGVSWYEAEAYANWKGKQLPDRDQWWRAAVGEDQPFPWGNDVRTFDLRANFGLAGTSAAGRYPLGVSPFGVLDTAGNVREWLADPGGADRFSVTGGSWQDPTYMFDASTLEAFPPTYASDAIGFRLVIALPPEQ